MSGTELDRGLGSAVKSRSFSQEILVSMTILKRTATPVVAVSIFACARLAYASDTCAYIIGTVRGNVVATPAVLVITPSVSVVTTPARVVVDETTQSIVGYQLNTPLLDGVVPGDGIFVPAHQVGIGASVATLDELHIGTFRCINLGASTPAVPIHVPPSYLEGPGVTNTTPGVTLTISQKQVTVPAVTVSIPQHEILLPGIDQTVPPLHVETPEQTIFINREVAVHLNYLPPVEVIDGGAIIDNT